MIYAYPFLNSFYNVKIFANYGHGDLPHAHFMIYPIKYNTVNNATTHPRGQCFKRCIGKEYIISIMRSITPFIWKVFKQSTDAKRRFVPSITAYITNFTNDDGWAFTMQPNIEVNAYTLEITGDDTVGEEFTMVMHHEMAHILQWTGEGTAPGGLTEGMAEYVKFKAGYGTLAEVGEGKAWDEGYGVACRFLLYCDSLKPDFAPDLNNKMRKVFKVEYFQEMLGKPVDQRWKEYKAKYEK